ncbi:MAG: hypothetical protein U1E65_21745 [Myxococcota bacterium]
MVAHHLLFEELEPHSRAAVSLLTKVDEAEADLGAISDGLRTAQHVGWALRSAAELEPAHRTVGAETLDSVGGLLATVLVAYPALQARWSDVMAGDPDSEQAATLGELTERALRAVTTLLGAFAAWAKRGADGGER